MVEFNIYKGRALQRLFHSKRAEKILLMTPGKSGLPGTRQAIIISADCLQGSKTFNSYNLTVKNENTSV